MEGVCPAPSHSLLPVAVILLLVSSAFSSARDYLIKPSLDDTRCSLAEDCLTLSQFATTYNGSDTIIALRFLPGVHTLDTQLALYHMINFSMTIDGRDDEDAIIQCLSSTANFSVTNVSFITVKGLQFNDCGGNKMSQVERLVFEDTVFQDVRGEVVALTLRDITEARIIRSSFIDNRHGRQRPFYVYFNDPAILQSFQFEPGSLTGGALYAANSNISFIGSSFLRNSATLGGAMFARNCTLTLSSSTFSDNWSIHGGFMVTSESTVDVDNCTFEGNFAHVGGVLMSYNDVYIINGSNFEAFNYVLADCGVIAAYNSEVVITGGFFSDNIADRVGGVTCATNSSVTISNTTFTTNYARAGPVVASVGESVFNITGSAFTENTGGVIHAENKSSFIIIESNFTRNSASNGGVIVSRGELTFHIINCNFYDNTATYGGVLDAAGLPGSFYITESEFSGNRAETGGVVACVNATFTIDNSRLTYNEATGYGGVMSTINCSIHIGNSSLEQNLGSLYVFNSNLTINHRTRFEGGREPPKNLSDPLQGTIIIVRREGGAITSFQSTVIFTGDTMLSNNRADRGGAVLATASSVVVYGEITIANNTATNDRGGGVSLQQSSFEIKGTCTISGNSAMEGGGIQATSSTIDVYQPNMVHIVDNHALVGGGIHLEVTSRLNLFKSDPFDDTLVLIFTGNQASYGGAIYVADNTNAGACSSYIVCFVQTLVLHNYRDFSVQESFLFLDNIATEKGSDIFGGLFDRCIPSPFAEVFSLLNTTRYSGITYLETTSNVKVAETVASQPVHVCICGDKTRDRVDCSYQPPPIRVRRGETFTVSVVAVDQVNHTVAANIITSLSSSSEGGLGEGQQTQTANETCTDLTFNVFSPHDIETLTLYADGPCGNADLSTRLLTVEFLNCTCPIGLEPITNSRSETRCECDCDSDISAYLSSCNSTTGALTRSTTNAWITYVNDTDPPGFIIHPNCPFDYCLPPSEDVSFNFNLPEGEDVLCANNRRGVLCGSCRQNFSLSLGGSRCLPCEFYWPGILVVIIVAFIAAGILLVTALLALNMTVAVGLINSFIFYANIVAAANSAFFLSSEPSFPVVFVALLNLDFEFDICFFDGLDAYTKTWLQLAFPVYIISLVVVVIIVSEYSPKFAALIGKRDPIATLATLVLLSYAKLLSVTITALSFANLDYPDGSRETVWLPDGNVKYFQGKHIPLVLVALLIILLALPYTILLLFWQLIIRAPSWRALKWTRNTKLNAFIAAYHVPYNSRYRYWTGLLLLFRIILYLISAVTSSTNAQTVPFVTIILLVALYVLKGTIGLRIYRNFFTDIVDTAVNLNLLALAFTLYDSVTNNRKSQNALVYTSTAITFVLLVGVIIYHIVVLIQQKKASKSVSEQLETPVESNEVELVSVQPKKEKVVTHSVFNFSEGQSVVHRDRVETLNHHRKVIVPPSDYLKWNGSDQQEITS